jgi:hypothetical protein
MSCLPQNGRVQCTACFNTSPVTFDKTQQTEGSWRITANPLAWGNPQAEIVVLGFSKGPTQAGALANTPHDEIAYKGSRLNVGKILAHVGLLEKGDNTLLKDAVDKAIADKNGRFHFSSFIRCTVEQCDAKTKKWKGSGGCMLDKFVATDFGKKVSQQCSSRFLGNLPPQTKLVIMFGMGSKQNYVREAYKLFQHARPGEWRWLKEGISYTDDKITVVHVEHFAAQGALIPNWLGEKKHERSQLGNEAKLSIEHALNMH